VLHVSGQGFASHVAISFLLNGRTAPGAPRRQSDDQGQVQATLTITANWPLGRDTLSARDAQGNSSKPGVNVAIVPQGVAHTPGPNGSPPDDASFTIKMQLSKDLPCFWLYSCDTDQRNSLLVTGHPDPSGGTVCGPLDDGQAHSFPDQDQSGGSHTYITGCSGTYKGGAFTYMQTEQSYSDNAGGVTCPWNYTTAPLFSLEGTFTDPTTLTGTWTMNYGAGTINCSDGTSQDFDYLANPDQGTWTGTTTTAP
jgi:hypothetical protein